MGSHRESESPSDAATRATIDPLATFGTDSKVGPGSILVGHCVIADDVVIGPGCVLDAGDGTLVVEPGARIGAGVTIGHPVTVGRGARLQPGTTVLRDVPPHAIVAGNPAEISGYTTPGGVAAHATAATAPQAPGFHATSVAGVTFHRLPKVLDLRGNLTVGEFDRTIPFLPRRHFMVFGVPNSEIRGEHAHRTCHQFLICAHGSCTVLADDGLAREEFLLDDPSLGLHLPPLTWGVQYKYSRDAVLLVFASEFYDSAEYVRDYAEFMALSRPPREPRR